MKKFKYYLNRFFKTGMIPVLLLVISNFFNFLFNAYLGREVTLESFAVVGLLSNVFTIFDIPINSISKAISYKSAFLLGRYSKPVNLVWHYTRKKIIWVSLIFVILWMAASPFTTKYFNLDSILPMFLFGPALALAAITAVDKGYLSGNFHFTIIGVVGLIEALSRLLFAYLFISFGFEDFAFYSIPMSVFPVFIIYYLIIKKNDKKEKIYDKKLDIGFAWKFYGSSVLSKISTVSYVSLDVVLAKHFLSPADAGLYTLMSLVGKMVYFAGNLFSQFLQPLVSRAEGANKSSKNLLYLLLIATGGCAFASAFLFGVLGRMTLPYLFGEKIIPVLNILPLYALSMACFTVAMQIISYYQVKHKQIFPLLSMFLGIVQVIGIYIFNNSINDIANVMITLGFLYLILTVLLHIYMVISEKKTNHISLPGKIDFIFRMLPAYLLNLFETDSNSILLPEKIGRFSLIENLQRNKSFPFAIGLYKDRYGKKAVAKIWSGNHYDQYYYSLVREILLYKSISKVQNKFKEESGKRISTPNFVKYIKSDKELILLIEYVQGKMLSDYDIETQLNIVSRSSEYLKNIGSKLSEKERANIRYQTKNRIIFQFFITALISLVKRKGYRLLILKSIYIFIKNIWLVDENKNALVHGDLHTKNILVSKKNIYILDFEQSLFIHPVFEIVTTLSSSNNSKEFVSKYYDNALRNLYTEGKIKEFIFYSIYNSIFNFASFKKTEKLKSYVNVFENGLDLLSGKTFRKYKYQYEK